MEPRRVGSLLGWAAAVTFCCGLAGPLAADPPPWNVRLVGQIGGWVSAVGTDGSYAYLSEGGTVTVLDVSSPTEPSPIGRLSFDDFYVLDIQVRDSIAYLGGNSFARQPGLHIADLKNPRLPSVLSFYPAPEVARGVYVKGDVAYVACSDAAGYDRGGGFQIIDIADPSSPTLCAAFIEARFVTREIYVANDTAYVAARDGLHIFDVRTPSLPRRLARYDQRECDDVIVFGGLAYTATYYGLEIVDVTSPTAPTRRGILGGSGANALAMLDGLIFTGFGVIDVTNPSSPTLLGSFPYPRPEDIAASSGTAYLTHDQYGLSIMDVGNPSSPTLRATYDTLSDTTDVYVSNGVACVADGVRGLKTIDVSDPRMPTVLGDLPTSGRVYRLTVSGTTAYVGGRSGDTPETPRAFIHIVDITTPSTPRLLGTYERPRSSMEDVTISANLIYFTNVGGVRIVDVTNPSSPTLRGAFDTQIWATDIFISGNLAFVADYSAVRIVDITNPASPFLRSSFPSDGWHGINDVFVSNGIAYMTGIRASPDANFACVDVTDPDAPALLGTYDLPGFENESAGLYVSNGLAYVILDDLRVIDVSDPTAPELCGYYPTRRSIFGGDVYVYDDLVYLADFAGLRIFQFTGAAAAGRSWPLYE